MTVALASLSDAALASALVDGDPDALGVMYERFGSELFDTAAGTLRDSDEAADVVQEVFIAAAMHIDQLRDRSRLRPWLYSVMRNKTYDRIKARRRAVPHDPTSLPEEPTDMPERTDLYDADDLSQLVRSAASGLDVRDQLVLELSERQGLSGRDLADALGVTENQSYTLVHRMRSRARRSVGAYCVAKTGRSLCSDLDEILAGWDGEMTVLLRKRLARHIDQCDQCNDTRRKAMPVGLMSSAPAFAAPPELRDRVLRIDPRTARPTGYRFDADGFPRLPRRYRFGSEGRYAKVAVGTATIVVLVAGSMLVGSSRTAPDEIALVADVATSGSSDEVAIEPSVPAASFVADAPVAVTADALASTLPSVAAGSAEAEPGSVAELVVESAAGTAVEAADDQSVEPAVETTLPAPKPSAHTSIPLGDSPVHTVVTPSDTAPVAEPPVVLTPTPSATVVPRPSVPESTVVATVPEVPASSTTSPPPSTEPESPPAAAVLMIKSSTVDLGPSTGSVVVGLRNIGDAPALWSVAGLDDVVQAAPANGSLAPTDDIEFTVSVDRSGLGEGDHERAIDIVAGSSQVRLVVRFAVDRDPVIDVLGAPGPRDCPDAVDPFAYVSVEDESELASVVLSWRRPTGEVGEQQMVRRNGDWYGSLPSDADEPGAWVWKVVAVDVRGNTESVGSDFAVDACHRPTGPSQIRR